MGSKTDTKETVGVRKTRQGDRDLQITVPPAKTKHLSHQDYTVGWICALPLELTAARAMLDEEHSSLSKVQNDPNTYVLGSIGDHNVAMVCLPSGVYGKASAAAAATSMQNTFSCIDIYLLVGIGGGIPRLNEGIDIRLGDVVVSTPTPEHPAVVQYDYGKTGNTGFESKGTLNKPKASLLSAVSILKSQHDLYGDQIPSFINSAINDHSLGPEYLYPGTERDILWEPACGHNAETISCNCTEYKHASRPPPRNKLKIFYGSIGSGDQVIKDHRTRNDIARRHGILCLEMEAAGLMDTLQALVIRGICDYCDSRKSKEFQPYAALAAAAYARELLSIMPASQAIQRDQRTEVKDMLAFAEADNRRATVKAAHSQTCNWLLKDSLYRDWQNPATDDHKLLWVKGKAGIGKSTIMKFLHDHIRSKNQADVVIISFFFNAQGSEFEKSVLGLYRSLLSQIFSQMPRLDDLLDSLSYLSTITVNHLEDVLRDVITRLGSTQLTCFVDALDECPEDQIREMLRFWEEIIRLSTVKGTKFHVLFSSRHYPNISITIGRLLILEQKDGQWNDLRRYINAELRIGNTKQAEEIKDQVLRKSSRIFLWVVLVVLMLNREFDKGRIHTLSERLAQVPKELDKLFYDILARDNENLPELILFIRWMLYSRRPLSPRELYFALLTNDEDANLEWDEESITKQVMDKMIIDYSKGLAETTWSLSSSVQFIHESVREFLQKPDALKGLYPGFEGLSEEKGHECLRDGCNQQLSWLAKRVDDHDSLFFVFLAGLKRQQHEDRLFRTYPFLRYAIKYVLSHANKVDAESDSNIKFLQSFDTKFWLYQFHINPTFDSYYHRYIMSTDDDLSSKIRAHMPPHVDDDLGITLARERWNNLLGAWWKLHPPKETVLYDLMYGLMKRGRRQAYDMLSAYINHKILDMPACLPHLEPLTRYLLVSRYRDTRFDAVAGSLIDILRYCWEGGDTSDIFKVKNLVAEALKSSREIKHALNNTVSDEDLGADAGASPAVRDSAYESIIAGAIAGWGIRDPAGKDVGVYAGASPVIRASADKDLAADANTSLVIRAPAGFVTRTRLPIRRTLFKYVTRWAKRQ